MTGPDSADLRAQVDAAIAASQARVVQYEMFAARANALSDHVRAQMPAMWTLTAVACVAAVTVPVEMWQVLALVCGWPQLPYQVRAVTAGGVPLLVLGMLLLARHARAGVVLIAGAVTWVAVAELFWTAPRWALSVAAAVNMVALATYLWVSLRRVRGLRVQLQQLWASYPGPGGP